MSDLIAFPWQRTATEKTGSSLEVYVGVVGGGDDILDNRIGACKEEIA